MTLKGPKLEAALVSMAGTFIYLHELASTLNAKPLVPKSVEGLMHGTQGELAGLQVQLEATRQAALKDAEPLLTAWLNQMGLHVGGVLRARTQARAGTPLWVTGGIARARLHHYAINGSRVVDIALDGAKLSLPDARILSLVNDIPVREQASFNLNALRDVETKDLTTGAMSKALHVRVALQATQRRRWQRDGLLELM